MRLRRLASLLLACSASLAPLLTGARRRQGAPVSARQALPPSAPSPSQDSAVSLLVRLSELAQELHRHHLDERGSVTVPSVAQLSALRLSELRAQCQQAGVPEGQLDDAMEAESAKLAVAELLFRATAQTVPARTPAQTAFAAAFRYEQGGPGQAEPFDAAREMLLSAALQHSAERCVYYLLYNTEPKFGMARALSHFIAPAMAMNRDELQRFCAHPMLLSLERTPFGQHILSSVTAAESDADAQRLRADVYLSQSKLELADKVMQAIRPELGSPIGPAGPAELPPIARKDIIDTRWLQFQVRCFSGVRGDGTPCYQILNLSSLPYLGSCP